MDTEEDAFPEVTSQRASSTSEQHRCQWVGCSDRPTFTEPKLLYEHLLQEHCEWPIGSPPLLCWWQPCEHFSKDYRAMRAHLLSHVAYYAFKCEYCGRPAKRGGDLRKHERGCGKAPHKQLDKDAQNSG
jgi:hypothetical protein